MLSIWWGGQDDIFWRSQTSGGRATVRRKSNKTTQGQYGDIAAVDSRGADLLKVCTWELKTGYAKETLIHLLDKPRCDIQSMWEKWIEQASVDAKAAGARWWVIVHQRKGRAPLICIPNSFFVKLYQKGCFSGFTERIEIYNEKFGLLVLLKLQDWLECVTPDAIRALRKRKIKARRRK